MAQPRGPRAVMHDLTGEKILGTRWTVLSRNYNQPRRGVFWNVLCECGNTSVVNTGNLRAAASKSCGCLSREVTSSARKTHGMSKKPVYKTWMNMKSRCTNPNHNEYKNYGERGISICERWFYSFENFYADMGEPPTPDHSIDRIDVNGNYEPDNTRWATSTEQNANKRKVARIDQYSTEEILQELDRRGLAVTISLRSLDK